ncbi:MAG: O-antigen ligase family protein [Candidatus Actinomarina sp.]
MILKNKNIVYLILFIGFLFNALDAFSVFGVPLPWVSTAIFLFLFINLIVEKKFEVNSLVSQYFYWTIYCVLITIIFLFFQYETLITNSIASPLFYVLLRLLNFLSFFSIIYSLNKILNINNRDKIIELISYASIIISVLSLVSYFSYVMNFPDLSRNRMGTGIGFQSIIKACTVLRNYGTFREPSFLAVWIAPTIPLYFYNAREKNYWYVLSVLPITCLVLTRSLTGVMSFIIAVLLVFILSLLQKSKLNLRLLFPIFVLGICLVFANLFAYKFPPLDEDQCPPYTPDYCSCEYYDDEQDRAKNSTDITTSIFSRLFAVINSGISSFDSLNLIRENMYEDNVSILGSGLGISNIKFSDNYAINKTQSDLQYLIRNGVIIERYENSIVSFNNLYLNILFSTGIFGFFWLILLLIKTLKNLPINNIHFNQYLNMSIFVILIMYFFQGEELSVWLATFIGLFISEKSNV